MLIFIQLILIKHYGLEILYYFYLNIILNNEEGQISYGFDTKILYNFIMNQRKKSEVWGSFGTLALCWANGFM